MNRSSEDIEREVEAAREDLDQTVEALKSKMSPGQILDELTRSLKGTGAESMVSNLGAQVKENPLAVAMIGAGMAWLMMGKKEGAASETYAGPADYGDFQQHDTYAPSSQTNSASSEGSALKDKVSGMASHAKEGVMGAAGHAKHSAQHLGEQAAHAGQKIQRTFMDTLEQEPLIVGALGLAVGVAMGAALPATRVEDKTFGKMRDQVLEKGREAARQGMEMATDAAEAAYQGARDTAQEQGLVGQDGPTLADKAETVIRAGVDAARERLDEGRSH
jgi:hypothetical protein